VAAIISSLRRTKKKVKKNKRVIKSPTILLTKERFMKKGIAVITAVVVLTVTGMSFAQMNDKGKEMMGDKSGMMEGKGGMMGMMGGKGMMGMMGMMHGMMGSMMRTAVATSDGGVVVLNGTKLVKFDKNLNVVKETELKPDTEGMKSMMDQMKQACPMMGQMMGGNMGQQDTGKTANTSATSSDIDHASHH
jgi:hypothetical protein